MIAVIHTMSGQYPYPASVELFTDDKLAQANETAMRVIMEQEPEEPEATIRAELEKDGQYRPSKYSEWSVSVVQGLAVT